MSDDELRAACEYVLRICSKDGPSYTVAEAYLADLDRRKVEEAERAMPVTEEWLLEKAGFVKTAEFGIIRWVSDVPISFNGDVWHISFIEQRRNPTRGQLLDLLAGLGGEVKL